MIAMNCQCSLFCSLSFSVTADENQWTLQQIKMLISSNVCPNSCFVSEIDGIFKLCWGRVWKSLIIFFAIQKINRIVQLKYSIMCDTLVKMWNFFQILWIFPLSAIYLINSVIAFNEQEKEESQTTGNGFKKICYNSYFNLVICAPWIMIYKL